MGQSAGGEREQGGMRGQGREVGHAGEQASICGLVANAGGIAEPCSQTWAAAHLEAFWVHKSQLRAGGGLACGSGTPGGARQGRGGGARE